MEIYCYLLFLGLLLPGCVRFWGPSVEETAYLEAEAEKLWHGGQKFYGEGNYSEAVRVFHALIERYPDSERCDDSYHMLALSHYQIGNYREAISASRALIREFPTTPHMDEAHKILAQSYHRDGDYLNSCYEYLWILDRSANRELKREARDEFLELVERRLALGDLSALLAKYPKTEETPSILYEMGRRKLSQGDLRGAREIFTKLVSEFPESEHAIQVRSFVDKKEPPPGAPRIGLITPLTGEYAGFGMAVRRGVELALEATGAELLILDSGGDPIEALRAARRLVRDERVTVIIGPVMSMPTVAAAAIANSFGVPLITPTATEGRIASIGPYIFQLNPSIEAQARTIAHYAVRRMELTTFAILRPNDSYGFDLTRVFSQEVAGLGQRVIAVEGYEEGTTDFREQLLRIKAAEPEAIFVPAYPNEVVLIAPQIRYHEIQAQILGADGWKSEEVVRLGEDYVEGVVFVSPSLKSESFPAKDFIRRYERQYGSEPSRSAALAYDAVKIVLEAVSSGAVTPVALREYLASVADYHGASGLVSLAGSGSSGGVSLYTIEQGEIVEVRQEKLWQRKPEQRKEKKEESKGG